MMNSSMIRLCPSRRTRSSLSAAVVFVALLTVQCNRANCEELRDELFAEKLTWQDCEVDQDCAILGGSTRDCTGILSCNFAVNVRHRDRAERRVASLPEETADCYECASPNCVSGDIALCEPITKTCMIVTRIVDIPDPDPEPPGAGGGGGAP
jgi:hypothetical protein